MLPLTYRITFGTSRRDNIIPQQQPFKIKEDSHKDSCRVIEIFLFSKMI